jgi:hypothetical protein
MRLINLTPHDIKVGDAIIYASGEIARCNAQTLDAGEIQGIPMVETRVTGVSGVPNPHEGVAFIVPSIVRQHFPERQDLLSPSKFIRDSRGVITGCLSLERNPKK